MRGQKIRKNAEMRMWEKRAESRKENVICNIVLTNAYYFINNIIVAVAWLIEATS